jgi:hypothetical protein
MRKKIDESKLAELTQGYFEKAHIPLEVDDWRFYVCKTVLALVFHSALGVDLGYDNVYNPPLFTAFKTSDWTDSTGVPSEKLKSVVQPWFDAGKLSSLTVWDLDEICKRLSKAYSVFSGGDHLLFNCRANIIAALKANYGADEIGIRHGVLGHNSPVVDSFIYHVLTESPYNNMLTNPTYRDTLQSDAFGTPIENVRWDIYDLTNKITAEVNDLYHTIQSNGRMQELVIEALTLLNGDTVTVAANDNPDMAKAVGNMVVSSQQALMKTLTDSLTKAISQGNVASLERNKQVLNVTVHSSLSMLNSEYQEGDQFICYANENALPKKFIIPAGFELKRLEFWLQNGSGERIPEEHIKSFRVEIVLETTQ